jgi:putative copper export protein
MCLLLARWVNIYSSSLLLSLFAFRRLYINPALNGKHRCLPDQRYPNVLAWICWWALSISGILWLVAVVSAVTGSGIEWAAAQAVVGGTQFGHLWMVRSLVGLAIAGGLLRGTLTKESRAHSDLLWIALATINLGLLAWAGHAGAAGSRVANFHVLSDLVHLLTSAVWPAGVLPLTVWLFAHAKERGHELLDCVVLHRFSAISLGAVALLATSGLLNSLFMVKRFSDLYATTYGQVLTGKIVLFCIMIGLGAENRRLLKVQRRQRGAQIDEDRTDVFRLFGHVCAESALAFIVFGLAAALGATAPPV